MVAYTVERERERNREEEREREREVESKSAGPAKAWMSLLRTDIHY